MMPQEQEAPLRERNDLSKEEPGIKEILKWWIQPPTLLLSIVILTELYIVIAYHVIDITLLIALLATVAIFAGIGIKDILGMIAAMKGFSLRGVTEQRKEPPH